MLEKKVSTCLIALLLLGMIMAFPTSVKANPTDVSVINATLGSTDYGTTLFNFSGENPPPTDTGYPLGYMLANITVTGVSDMGGWQLNLTWQAALLEIATVDDIYRTSDMVFGLTGIEVSKQIEDGTVFWGCSRGSGQPVFEGDGVLCQIKFNITQTPSSSLSCDLVLDQVSAFPTEIYDHLGLTLTYTPQDGRYEYWYYVFIPKPYLEVYPSVVEQGLPMGACILGTAKENFTIDIIITDIISDAKLIAYQFKFLWNRTSDFEFIDIEEGPFLQNSAWAPAGAYFFITGEGVNATHEWFIVIGIITPPWGPDFPDSTGLSPEDRSLCTITFKSTKQEEYPWELYTSEAFAMEYVWPTLPERTFENVDEGWIANNGFIPGDYHITGYVLGRMIDIYTQYDYPYGGQGLNMPSDMFWPQKEVILCANVTYNLWPVQNKIVTFEVRNPAGVLVTVLTDITDEDGVACVSYRIPWPCDDPEELFGVWTVVGSVDIACEIVVDTLWFHFDYLVRWVKVTVEPDSVAHCENVTITVEYMSHAMQTYNVLITVALHDDLNYPIETQMLLVAVGGAVFCEYKQFDPIAFSIHIPKHAVPGVAKIHVNALSDLPSEGGCAWVPEYIPTPEVMILAEWA